MDRSESIPWAIDMWRDERDRISAVAQIFDPLYIQLYCKPSEETIGT